MRIRQAKPEDAPAIHALMLEAFGPFRAQYTQHCFDATVLDPRRIQMRMGEGPIWVAEEDGHIIGTVSAVPDGNSVYVRGMAVHPDAQRSGVGRHLLRVAEGYADGRRAKRLWLSTTTFLDASQELYRSMGMTETSGPPDLHGTPLVSFEKSLP